MTRLVILLVLLLARPVTQEEADAPPESVHSIHNEDGGYKFAVHAGAGSTRQLLVFCLHPDERTPYHTWKVTLLWVEDAPEGRPEGAPEP